MKIKSYAKSVIIYKKTTIETLTNKKHLTYKYIFSYFHTISHLIPLIDGHIGFWGFGVLGVLGFWGLGVSGHSGKKGCGRKKTDEA